MKLISSLVRPARLDAVKQARDYAPQNHGMTAWRGHLHTTTSSPKLEIQVVVHDDDVDEVVDVVMRAARTGRAGDGHICVISLDHRYNISSGRREV